MPRKSNPKGSRPTVNKSGITTTQAKDEIKGIKPVETPEERVYICCCCGKQYKKQDRNFSYSQSPMFKGNNSYLPICNHCLENLVEQYTELLGSQDEAIKRVCLHWDMYVDEKILSSTKKIDANRSRIRDYVRHCNLNQNAGKTYDTYLYDLNKAISQTKNTNVEISKKNGNKYTEDEESETEWSLEEQKNKNEVIEVVGYDPFAGYKDSDRRYFFNELIKYLDDDVVGDNYKLSQLIQIVNNNNQIRQCDLIISRLNPLDDSDKIQQLNEIKNKLVAANDKIAKENEISVKNRSNKDIGKSTLTYLMKDLREKNFEKAEADYYEQLMSAGTRWAMELSVNAIQQNTYFDENDYNEIKDIRREVVDKLQTQVDKLTEEKRQLLIEIQKLKSTKGDNSE